jgi:hypothetical protein
MKMIIALFMLILTAQTFGSTSLNCKDEALKAAYERYAYEFPEQIISIQAIRKPVLSGEEIHHTIQVVDLDTGIRTMMGVITERKSCKIIAVN